MICLDQPIHRELSFSSWIADVEKPTHDANDAYSEDIIPWLFRMASWLLWI
jgi:hypothetical protein